MLDSAVNDAKLSKAEFEAVEPGLRVELLNAQFDLQQRGDTALLVLLAGDDRVGCDEVFDRLHQWMDARRIDAAVFPAQLTDEEHAWPPFWRYWQALPGRGRTGLFFGGWVNEPLVARLTGKLGKRELGRRIEQVRALERTLVADGTTLLKLWIHLPHEEHRKRVRRARRKPEKEWRVEDGDIRLFERLDEALPLAEDFLQRTDTAHAPWVVVDGSDDRQRDVSVGRAVLGALQRALATPVEAPGATVEVAVEVAVPDFGRGPLDELDLATVLPEDEYEQRLEQLQARLSKLSRKARRKGVASVLVFEGWDAAGKGGAIRRLTGAMSARDVKVLTIAAPTDEERAHHYLWRFWRRLPRPGRMAIFDRSWYGRVLVERVEGFATEAEWRRAYEEIDEFESQLVEHGLPLCKFWLHIDREEQERRFRAREHTPYKKYKLTDEDRRNRARWDEYVRAVHEMLHRTSTPAAPWTLVAANDKRHARIRVLEQVCARLEERL
jgi:polyphosphate:AMP phosphotransferase